MPDSTRSTRATVYWSITLLSVAIVLAGINYYVFVPLKHSIIRQDEAQLQRLVDGTIASVETIIRLTQGALDNIKTQYEAKTIPQDMHVIMRTTVESMPFVRAMGVISIDGRLLHSSRSNPPPTGNLLKIAPVVYFSSLAGRADSFYVSGVARNQLDGHWQLSIAIPVRNQSGEVTAIISAVFEPDYLYKELFPVSINNDGTISLVDNDFDLIARSPWVDKEIGRSMAAAKVFQSLINSRDFRNWGIFEDFFTGKQQLMVAGWLLNGRLALSASRTMQSVLGYWRPLSALVAIGSIAILTLLVISWWLSARDATARRRANDRLLESERRFRLLVNAIRNYAVTMLGPDGNVVNWNVGGKRTYGYTATEATGHHFRRFYTSEDQKRGVPERALQLATETGKYQARTWQHRKDGESFLASVMIEPIRDDHDNLIGFVQITQDITQREKMHQALRAAKEQAENATRAKSEFLANMSHEIRTPLTGVVGYAELAMQDDKLSKGTRGHVARILDASKTLRVVIDDILDFSKMEAGEIALGSAPFSIATLADNCISMVRPVASSKGLHLNLNLDPAVPRWLSGDRLRLGQVLLNLLNNAIKFTETGSVTLDINRESGGSETRPAIKFSVRDTGIGISPADQQKLFKRFSQADSSIARKYGGTGLGLVISSRLVELMGGELRLDSTIGEGSNFEFTLALDVSDEPSEREGASAPAVKLHRPLRVLVVDDLDMNRDLAKTMLSNAGCTVDIANDAASALKLVEDERYDLILMDIQMPGMDGLAATQCIRNGNSPNAEVPIYAMTANVLPDQVARMAPMGITGLIAKPFDRTELLAVVVRCADQPWERNGTVTPADIIPVFDENAVAELSAIVGIDRVAQYAGQLQAMLADTDVLANCYAEPQAMAAAAHRVVSLAGQLGLRELADTSRKLEAACKDGTDILRAYGAFDIARIRALPELQVIFEKAEQSELAKT